MRQKRALAVVVTTAFLVAGGIATMSPAVASPALAPATVPAAASGCQLGNGVQHVITLVFDNVHFTRDNPNVPSDLEQMPNLLSFLKKYGTVFSNVHTPLIAHTADDSLSIYTGLYGDRHGQPLTNSYKTYNPNGTTDPATSFAYWTSPVVDTAGTPASGHDSSPTMTYSATVPATGHGTTTPAPWVPFTRAGCSVGDFSTANMVLENTRQDISTVFGPNSPEVAQLNADSDPFKDTEVADYIGVAVHCAQGDSLCAGAHGVTDALPTEPGGYNGYQAVFGAKYVAPILGAGTPNLSHNGYAVTNSFGNLVDESGKQINGQFVGSHPGFPGFSPTATQSLAYIADMQEAGIPVTYGYISDIHEKKAGNPTVCTTATATSSGKAVGPGDACSVSNAAAYDQAFAQFFARLQADGITPANTVFQISAEENDQFSGANTGLAQTPTPSTCDGVSVACQYAAGQVGELQANIKGLLSTTASAGTPFDIEPQGASIYVHGQPGADDPATRQLERDTAAMTADNVFSGAQNEHIVKYQADAVEQRVLHMQTNDPLRTPTFTMFPMPDYFFATSGANVSVNSSFAWNHGYYSPNIDVTWAAFAGKGVVAAGVDGPQPAEGNEASDPTSTRTVPQASLKGTWVEETDLRPTLLSLTGLSDDYLSDGSPIVPALASAPGALVGVDGLRVLYQQINSSVGAFATDTLIAESRALASGSAMDDSQYAQTAATLADLADHRDRVAAQMKQVLAAAAAGAMPSHGTLTSLSAQATALLRQAATLAG
ncbi:hypothetical protein [Microbacterium candidum]|uniref:Phosphoesterase n=1 Tax=Microbacterium candidum TaxID=3041922 RepID=A0ABT7N3L7_9MICO|nr:hypothetical protein [Microbacterium sp. ASV49]MDL9981271.1 hypothetical protein [Microbacterium sp. ASV49]